MAIALLKGMAPPTLTNNSSPNLGPYRLSLDMGPSWLDVSSSTGQSASFTGFETGLRLGSSYNLSGDWNWRVDGVFSYANYYGESGNMSRVGVGLETGPEWNISPRVFSLGATAGFQAAFHYSEGISWPSRSGTATFENNTVSAVTLRLSAEFLGFLSLSYLFGHDFGLDAPGLTRFDSPEPFTLNRHSLLISADVMRMYYRFRENGFDGPVDSFEEFLEGVRPSILVEGSYNYTFGNPLTETGSPGKNRYRTNHPFHNRARLNVAELALERPSTPRSPLGFRLDLDFGQDAISFAPRSSLVEPVIGERDAPTTQYFALQQAFATYLFPAMEGLTLKLGQFGTPVGNEIPEGPLNTFHLITRGLNNTLAEPFFHFGGLGTLRMSQQIDDRGDQDPSNDKTLNYFEVSAGIFNGWDSVLGHEGGPTAFIGMTHMLNPDFTYALNYLIGREGEGVQGLFNFNTAYQAHPNLLLGANLDLGHGNDGETHDPTVWFGLGLYQQFAPVSWWNLVAREELFTDPQGARSEVPQTLLSAALATNFLIPYGFGIGAEIRHDESVGREEDVPGPFQSGNNPASGSTTFTTRAFWKYPW